MQDVNNDMDEMFQKAAEGYPLRTEGNNWDAVLQKLKDEEVSTPVLMVDDNTNTKKVIWLLLLLPLLLLYIFTYNHSNKATRVSDAKSSLPTLTIKNQNQIKLQKEVIWQRDFSLKNKTATKNVFIKNSGAITQILKDVISQKPLLRNPRVSTETFGADNEIENNITGNFSRDLENVQQPLAIAQRSDDSSSRQLFIPNANEELQTEVESTTTSILKQDSIGTRNTAADKKTTINIKPKLSRQKGFYTGLLAGFDISTIKLQTVKNTGYNLTVLVGYRFSKHTSVESGIGWNQKKYYTIGQYFDKSRTGIPAASEILYTNGNCNMFEIPLSVTYDVAQKQNSNWFVSAGLSSYIMKKEKYSYYADHEGNYYYATKKYKNSGNNWLAVAAISAGYQYYINKQISLRAEPYLKMPLSGIGIAKLPITSAGVSVGFTKAF